MPGMGLFFAVVLCTCQPRGVVNATHWCFLPRARCRGKTSCCCGVLGSGCVPGSMCMHCAVMGEVCVNTRALWKGRVRAGVRGAYTLRCCIVHVAVLARTR